MSAPLSKELREKHNVCIGRVEYLKYIRCLGGPTSSLGPLYPYPQRRRGPSHPRDKQGTLWQDHLGLSSQICGSYRAAHAGEVKWSIGCHWNPPLEMRDYQVEAR